MVERNHLDLQRRLKCLNHAKVRSTTQRCFPNFSTGSTPRHAKGLSTCCHGEEPHVVGWRFIADRRAISLDPNCGWTRGKADVVYVADAFPVMAKVNALLESAKK